MITVKKVLLAGVTVLLMAAPAHAGVDIERGRCYTSDKVRIPCSSVFGKDWRKIFKQLREDKKRGEEAVHQGTK
jgi:hypothetical protein